MLTRKSAVAISSVLSIAEYVRDQPEISDKSKARLHHPKLDPGSRQRPEKPQQTDCTTIGGFASLAGPQDKELIRFVPQLLK